MTVQLKILNKLIQKVKNKKVNVFYYKPGEKTAPFWKDCILEKRLLFGFDRAMKKIEESGDYSVKNIKKIVKSVSKSTDNRNYHTIILKFFKIKTNDIILACKGNSEVIGIGEVKSNTFRYNKKVKVLRSEKPVSWLLNLEKQPIILKNIKLKKQIVGKTVENYNKIDTINILEYLKKSFKETAKIADPNILTGEKLYLQRARKTFPYLVRQAIAGQTIYYSDLAYEVGISNPRNLNFVLGAIGNALNNLGKKTKKNIPPIQCLVINKQTNMPSEGFNWFLKIPNFNKLSMNQRREIINRSLTEVFSFPDWYWVLDKLGLKPLESNLQNKLKQAGKLKGYGGESLSHKKFKEYVSKHPSKIGLSKKVDNYIIEYNLPSADCIDVLFIEGDTKIGVEVKSKISSSADILRGLFQCVKYKILLESEQAVNNLKPNCRVILALESKLPHELIQVKNILNIEVKERVRSTKV